LTDNNATRYYLGMIRSFHSRLTEQLFARERVSKLPPAIQKIALRKLVLLDAAVTIDDLRIPPGNRLEKLKGVRKKQHSIRINDQWHICFEFRDGNAYNVEIVDYH